MVTIFTALILNVERKLLLWGTKIIGNFCSDAEF